MERRDRKKLTACEFYLEKLMSTLYTKVKVIVSGDKVDANGYQHFCFENYEHGTITVSSKGEKLRAALDGTNYVVHFSKSPNGGLAFKCKQLGIEYVLIDEELEEGKHLKKIMRKVGDTSGDYIKYLVADDNFFIMLEHYKKDEEGVTAVSNNVAYDYDSKELVNYIEDAREKVQAFEEENDSETDIDPTISDYQEEDDDSDREEEIEAVSSDDYYDDYLVIQYESSVVKNEEDAPYSSELPDKVEEFDYEKQLRKYKKAEQKAPKVKENDNSTKSEETITVDYEALFEESDDVITDEGFINEEVYDVIQNGELIEDERKGEIVDELAVSIQDIDMEMSTLKDYYVDLINEVNVMKEIIRRRKMRMEKVTNANNKIANEDYDDGDIDI